MTPVKYNSAYLMLLFLKQSVPHVPCKLALVYLLSFRLFLLLNTSSYILVSILGGLLSRTCCGYYLYNFLSLALRRCYDFSLSSLRLKGEGFYIPEGNIKLKPYLFTEMLLISLLSFLLQDKYALTPLASSTDMR